jgi:mRNA interferase HicA
VKRKELVRRVEALGAILVREGGRHSVYENPYTKGTIAIPRHAEVNEHTAKSIIRAAGERPT